MGAVPVGNNICDNTRVHSLLHLFSIFGDLLVVVSFRFVQVCIHPSEAIVFCFFQNCIVLIFWGFPQLLSYGGHSSIHPLKTAVAISFPDTLYTLPYRATINGPHRPRAKIRAGLPRTAL